MAGFRAVTATVYVQQASRAGEIRAWLDAAGWAGDRLETARGLGFTVPFGGRGGAAGAAIGLGARLDSLVGPPDALAEIAALCAGSEVAPALGLTERLARDLGVHALAVVALEGGGERWHALVTWYGQHLAGLTIAGPVRQWSLRAREGEERVSAVVAEPVEDRVAAFLAEVDEDDLADVVVVTYADRVRARLVVLASLVGVVACTWIGAELGGWFGARGAGAAIGFYGAVGTGLGLLIRRGGFARFAAPAGLTAIGVAALGVARALGPTDAAPAVGLIGMACVGVGVVWSLNRL